MAFSGVRTKRSNLSAVLQKLHGSGFSSLPCKDDQDAVGSNLDSIFSTSSPMTRAAEQSKLEINGINNKTSEFSHQATSITTNSTDGYASIKGNRSPTIKSDCMSTIKDDNTLTNDHSLTEINHLLSKDGHIITKDVFAVVVNEDLLEVVKCGITEILEDITGVKNNLSGVDDDNLKLVKEDLASIKDHPTLNEDDHNCVKEEVLTTDDCDLKVEIKEVKSLSYSNSLTENSSKCETGTVSSCAATDVKPESDGLPEKFSDDVNTYPNEEPVEDGRSMQLTPTEVRAGGESSEVKLDRDFENDERNEVEDDEAKQITNNRKKSRRKQQKTHRVLWTEDSILASPTREKHADAAPSPLASNPATGSVSKSETETNPILGNSEAAMSDLDLPEGTVFVEPESVDTSPKFLSIESSRPKRIFKGGNLESAILHCTACNKQLGVEGLMDYHRHPMLKVLICRKCYNWYTSGEIEQDVDGSDEQCRWCKQGGDLICCDYCHNSFCKSCIRRNLGRKELGSILEADDKSKWKCYVCDPKSLLALIEHCSGVMEALAKQEKKQQELELRRKRAARPCGSAAPPVSGAANPPEISAPSASLLMRQPSSSLHSGQQQSSSSVYSRVSQAKSSSNFAGNSSLLASTGGTCKPGTSRSATAAPANHGKATSVSAANQNRQVTGHHRSSAASVTVASLPTLNSGLSIVRYKNVCYKDQLIMVEKLISVTASMQMFLKSLGEDFNRTKVARSSRNEPGAPTSASGAAAATSSPAASAAAGSSKASSLVSLLTAPIGLTPSLAGEASGSSRSFVKEVQAMTASEVSLKRNCIASKLVRASNSFLDSFKTIAQLESAAKTAAGFPHPSLFSCGSNVSSTAPGRAISTTGKSPAVFSSSSSSRSAAPKIQAAHSSATSTQQPPDRAVTIRTTAGHTSTSTRVVFPKSHAAVAPSTAAQKVTGILLTSKPSGSKLQMVTTGSGASSTLPSASLSPLGRSLPIVVRRVSQPTDGGGKAQNRSLPITPNSASKADDTAARLEEVLVISDSEDEAEKTATVFLPEIIIHDVVVDGKGDLVATGQPTGAAEEASVLTKNTSVGNLVLASKNINSSTSEAGIGSGSKGEEGSTTRAAATLSRSKRKSEAMDCASATSVAAKKVKVDDDTADQENLKVTSNLDVVKIRHNHLLEDSKNKRNEVKTGRDLLPKDLSARNDLDSERSSNKNDADASEEDGETKEDVKVPKRRGRKRKMEASDSQPASSGAAEETEGSTPKKSLVESPGLLRRSNRRISLTPQAQLPSPKKTPQSSRNDDDHPASGDKAVRTEDANGGGKVPKKTNTPSIEPNKRSRKSLPDSSSSLTATNNGRGSSALAKPSPKSSGDKNGIATRLRRSASRLASVANGTV